jgi:hypothetical protein
MGLNNFAHMGKQLKPNFIQNSCLLTLRISVKPFNYLLPTQELTARCFAPLILAWEGINFTYLGLAEKETKRKVVCKEEEGNTLTVYQKIAKKEYQVTME